MTRSRAAQSMQQPAFVEQAGEEVDASSSSTSSASSGDSREADADYTPSPSTIKTSRITRVVRPPPPPLLPPPPRPPMMISSRGGFSITQRRYQQRLAQPPPPPSPRVPIISVETLPNFPTLPFFRVLRVLAAPQPLQPNGHRADDCHLFSCSFRVDADWLPSLRSRKFDVQIRVFEATGDAPLKCSYPSFCQIFLDSAIIGMNVSHLQLFLVDLAAISGLFERIRGASLGDRRPRFAWRSYTNDAQGNSRQFALATSAARLLQTRHRSRRVAERRSAL